MEINLYLCSLQTLGNTEIVIFSNLEDAEDWVTQHTNDGLARYQGIRVDAHSELTQLESWRTTHIVFLNGIKTYI